MPNEWPATHDTAAAAAHPPDWLQRVPDDVHQAVIHNLLGYRGQMAAILFQSSRL